MDIADVQKNTKLLIGGVPHNVENVDFVKPGKGRAIYRLRLRNLLDGTLQDITYHSGDRVDETEVTTREMQYLYQENDRYVFMDTETFEQYFISSEQLGSKRFFLKDGMTISALMFKDNPIDITIPTFVDLEVISTEASLKTATVTAQDKTARLETGYLASVPSFIKEGDVIRIDTRTGSYVERVGTN